MIQSNEYMTSEEQQVLCRCGKVATTTYGDYIDDLNIYVEEKVCLECLEYWGHFQLKVLMVVVSLIALYSVFMSL